MYGITNSGSILRNYQYETIGKGEYEDDPQSAVSKSVSLSKKMKLLVVLFVVTFSTLLFVMMSNNGKVSSIYQNQMWFSSPPPTTDKTLTTTENISDKVVSLTGNVIGSDIGPSLQSEKETALPQDSKMPLNFDPIISKINENIPIKIDDTSSVLPVGGSSESESVDESSDKNQEKAFQTVQPFPGGGLSSAGGGSPRVCTFSDGSPCMLYDLVAYDSNNLYKAVLDPTYGIAVFSYNNIPAGNQGSWSCVYQTCGQKWGTPTWTLSNSFPSYTGGSWNLLFASPDSDHSATVKATLNFESGDDDQSLVVTSSVNLGVDVPSSCGGLVLSLDNSGVFTITASDCPQLIILSSGPGSSSNSNTVILKSNPTAAPTAVPTVKPTRKPTAKPTTRKPTVLPSAKPTRKPA